MKTIHKVPLEIAAEQIVALPIGAGLLDCQNQDGELMLWYTFDVAYASEPAEEVTFYVIGTGHSYPDTLPGKYFRTVQIGRLVWHVYFKPLGPGPAVQRKPIVVDPNAPGAEQHRGTD